MDLRAILNKPSGDKAAASQSSTTPRPPTRSASLVQHSPSLQQFHQAPHPAQIHPGLTRQQSFPAYAHSQQEAYANHHPHPHTSYAPYREEYFRDGSLSVSPKTQPHSISRHPSLDSYPGYDPSMHAEYRLGEAASVTPASQGHNREPSAQSHHSNHSSNFREPLSARDPQNHSPHFIHAASVTSSPIQTRPSDFQTPYHTNSPLDTRPINSFRQPTQSPLQMKQSPIMTKAMPPPVTPNQSHHASPLVQPREVSSVSNRSSPGGLAPKSRSGSIAGSGSLSAETVPNAVEDGPNSSRKRSLDSVGESARPIKRVRYSKPPKWAQRIQWKTNQKVMDEWIPQPRAVREQTADPRPSRIPSIVQPTVQIKREEVPIKGEDSNGTDSHAPKQANGTSHASGSRDFDVSPVGKYELSLDGIVPFSDITREVAQFLFNNVVKAPDMGIGSFEVEAKLGTIIDPRTGQRLNLPVSTEACLIEGHDYRFQSHMTVAQHKTMNQYLNIETQRSQRPDMNRQKIKYEHLRETDRFYQMPQEFQNSLPQPVKEVQNRYRHATPRVRVTTDQKTGQIKAAIYKLKVSDLEIFCPKDAFDVRISVALEIKYPYPTQDLIEQVGKNGDSGSRFKDRLSYKHQFVSVDLTQVTDAAEKKQELELEIDTDLLRDEGLKADAGVPNHYEGIVGIFTNYIRVMNRTCRPQ